MFLALALACISVEAQQPITQVQNLGDRYRVSAPLVSSPHVPFDTKAVRISVICLATFATEHTILPEGASVDYQLKGPQLVSASTLYYNKGVLVGRKDCISVCINGVNPISQCNKKL